VRLSSGQERTYDYLLVAVGTTPTMAQVPGMSKQALPLKSLDDAIALRNQAVQLVRTAERTKERQTVVICGAGPAGVELAGELRQSFDWLCARQGLSPGAIQVILVAEGQRVLPASPEPVQQFAFYHLVLKGVEVELSNPVVAVDGLEVKLARGSIQAQLIIWTGGNRPNPAIETMGLRYDRAGGIFANGYLQSAAADNVFVAGDCLHLADKWEQWRWVRKNAWYAYQTGRVAAENLACRLRGKPMVAYEPDPQGFLGAATLGYNELILLGRETNPFHFPIADHFYPWLARTVRFLYRHMRKAAPWPPWG